MKIATLVINQNQAPFIDKMLNQLKEFPSEDRYWVLDRCTDDSEKLLCNETNVIVNSVGEGFLAGKMRDLGLDVILEKDYDAVLFFDGDRITNKVVSKTSLENYLEKKACAMFLCEIDIRNKVEIQIGNPISRFLIFSCGLVISTKYLKKVRKLEIMKRRCFHSDFDGEWGLEDSFLGRVLYLVGASFGYITDNYILGNLSLTPPRQSSTEQREKLRILSKRIGFIPFS